MTYRERRMRRAERLREWAERREARAHATLTSQPELRHDWAFITQPGHIPERARMIRRDDRAHESLNKAAAMRSRAAGIEHQAERAIYSDDPDARERLVERIADLEGQRARWVAYNAACRKAKRTTAEALALLDDRQRADVARIAAVGMLRPNGSMPAYQTANLGGNIGRLRERLARMDGPKPRPTFQPDRRGVCRRCGDVEPVHIEPAPGALKWCP